MSETSIERTNMDRARTITITVNSRPVIVQDKVLTGLQIKEAAIAQGVPIQMDFLLSEHQGNGQARIVGDADEVRVHEHAKFTAIAGDDNS